MHVQNLYFTFKKYWTYFEGSISEEKACLSLFEVFYTTCMHEGCSRGVKGIRLIYLEKSAAAGPVYCVFFSCVIHFIKFFYEL